MVRRPQYSPLIGQEVPGDARARQAGLQQLLGETQGRAVPGNLAGVIRRCWSPAPAPRPSCPALCSALQSSAAAIARSNSASEPRDLDRAGTEIRKISLSMLLK